MKLTIHRYTAVASWRWIQGKEEDVCGICQNAYEETCPNDECRYPGEGCPIGMFCGLRLCAEQGLRKPEKWKSWPGEEEEEENREDVGQEEERTRKGRAWTGDRTMV
jgi:hypothetical protein